MRGRGVSDPRIRSLLGVTAPSLLVLALLLLGTATGQYWRYVLSLVVTAIVIGSALAMLVGFARCISLATGAMAALGAYGATLLVVGAGLPWPLAVAGGVLLGALGGLVLGLPSVRFRSHNLAMVTLVFQAVVVIVLREWRTLTNGAEGLNVPAPLILGVRIASDLGQLALIAGLGAAAVLLVAVLLRGPYGRNLKALAANEVGARAFGISIEAHLVAAFTISSAVIALAGSLAAPRFRIIDPDSFGLHASILALAYPIVGGAGSIWGGILGGGTMRLLPELLRPVADYLELLLSALILACVIFMPGGLIGLAARLRKAAPQPLPVAAEPTTPPARAAAPTRAEAALVVEDVRIAYGAVKAVDGVSFTVPAGTICGIMGPNGAGKTTLFNAISGFVLPDSGRVSVFGRPLIGAPAHARLGLGVARTFQQVAIFPTLTCRDNVVLGLGRNSVGRALAESFDAALDGSATRQARAQADAALAAVGLDGFAEMPAGSLSLGNQRRLEIARAIVSRPPLILLDEPVSGVAHEEAERIAGLLRLISRESGITMLVVEHDIGFLVGLCDHLLAMALGRVVAEGRPREVVAAEDVRRVYFGEVLEKA
jgi:branched-chain amino acid transport system permease protein